MSGNAHHVDVGALLMQARERAGISQRVLAGRVGTGQSAISMYESGAHSPTVRTLDRLLAACGLEGRVVLQPLGADVDAQVAGLLAGAPELDVESLLDLQRSLDDDPRAFRSPPTPWRPTGAVSWAFDGATALRAQGLCVAEEDIAVVVVLDEAARQWLWRLGVKGSGRIVAPHWLEDEPEFLAEVLAWPALSGLGVLRIRLAEVLPPLLRIAIGPDALPLPVVTVDGVAAAHPRYATVLAAWRQRQAQRRTVDP